LHATAKRLEREYQGYGTGSKAAKARADWKTLKKALGYPASYTVEQAWTMVRRGADWYTKVAVFGSGVEPWY